MPSTKTHPQDNLTVNLLALKEELKAELKQSLLEEFADMHKELASFKATIQSLSCPAETQATSFSDLATMLKAKLKGEITTLWAELQDAINELKESIVLLHRKFRYFPSQNTNVMPSLQERGDGRS